MSNVQQINDEQRKTSAVFDPFVLPGGQPGSGLPLVAVVVPFYRRTEALLSSLRSLAGNSAPHHVIVVDDGTEPPLELPEGVHPNVVVIRHRHNQGVTEAANTGVSHAVNAGYRYIARLDAGDRAVPLRIARQVEFLEQHPEVKLVGGYALFVDHLGTPLFTSMHPCEPGAIRRTMHRRFCIVHPSAMFRADVFSSVGLYREKYPAAEDYDLLFRIVERFPVANLPEVMVEYELTPDSISTRRRHAQMLGKLRIVADHFDWTLPESYVGILEGILTLVIPRSVTAWKRRLVASGARFLGGK